MESVTEELPYTCPDCDFDVTVGICWFSDQRYIVVGERYAPLECDKESCPEPAAYVAISSTEHVVRALCSGDAPSYIQRAAVS